MRHLEHIQLGSYVNPPDPAIVEVMPSGIEVIRRQHETTGQLITLIGSPHPKGDPKHPAYTDIEREWDLFTRTAGESKSKEVMCEGRTPAMVAYGQLHAGERTPVVNAHNRSEVIKIHTDLGIVTRLGRLSCLPVRTAEVPEADRTIALHIEQLGYRRLDIMRYYLYRQLPNYANIDARGRPMLADYIQQHVTDRYRAALHADWPDFDFAANELLETDLGTLDTQRSNLESEETEYFLSQTVHGVMYGKPDPTENLSTVQKLARAYNIIRTSHFLYTLAEDWGQPDTPHKFSLLGKSHLRAMSNELAKLGNPVFTS